MRDKAEIQMHLKETCIDCKSLPEEGETQWERAKDQGGETENLFRLFFEKSGDAYLILDEGKFINCNEAALNMMGCLSKNQLLGCRPFELSPEKQPDGRLSSEKEKDLIAAALDEGSIRFEWLHRRFDGKEFPVEVTLTNIPVQGRSVLHIAWRDISERKRVEEELRIERDHVQTLIQASPAFFTAIDRSGKTLMMNQAMLQALGYRLEEVTGTDYLSTFVPKEERERISQVFQGLLGKWGAIIVENPVLTKDGRELTVEWHGRMVFKSSGKPDYFFAVGIDITERKRAEEALRESESKYQTIFDSVNDGIFVHDIETGRIADFNNKALEMYGYSKEELMGSKADSVSAGYHPYTQKEAEKWMKKEALEGAHIFEWLSKKKNGQEFWTEVNLKRAFIGKTERLLAVVRDITERKRAEALLLKHTEELERSNQELEKFGYVASHDLQEPLRMVASYVQLLARRYQGRLDNDADEFIGFAVDGAKRMQVLINDLLAYSRVGTRGKDFEPTDGEALINDVLNNLKSTIEENGAMVTHDFLPTIMADNVQMGQVFQNLIGNAIKFHSDSPPRIHISAERKERGWVFSVKDNGIGIDPAYRDRIFEIFQRLHNREKYPGTGIGLAICKKIVERHGGRIWVESELEKGATFYFSIPEKVGTIIF